MNGKRLKFTDKPFIIALSLIILIGLVTLTSATYGLSSDPYSFLKNQLFATLIGVVAIIFIIRYDYTQLGRYSRILYAVSIITLIAILFIGDEVKGSTRAIQIAFLPAIQPTEFVKIFIILSFADFLNRRRGSLNSIGQFIPCFVYMGIPTLLIMAQPDLGTSLVFIAITLIMMFIAGANPKILVSLLVTGVLLISLTLFMHFKFDTWIPMDDYQLNRLTAFANPYEDGQGGRGAGWNTIQSLVAVGSGGLTGQGLFEGTQVQLRFLPEHHTDFIFAVIAEELGFIGGATIIMLFGFLLVRVLYIAANSRDLYGTLVATGICAMWLFHVVENIGMSIGIMPITGIPLPFISYGGSNMLSNLIAVGLILSINIRGKKIVF
ncbi:Rod shape-determining protein RodA [Candidatus Syntrophocurvum alkaliphilum]|uniref:Peptidoglycan glycosyltransferase RodA n=1 Tax=Candidatus Syntrophocurvum alkaliphilum TaxID=2293317 RepID=A0A6I6DLL3_9FIRM|nr:rod shape-determining protein RodA [Candidatus Syntrophocurvum alkaliphilum]QGU00042.1 Rod shape-determining protein RodA [Candidatus Syntrophocurvum alkaliphilum]